jgi:hypothetical protein
MFISLIKSNRLKRMFGIGAFILQFIRKKTNTSFFNEIIVNKIQS